MTRSGTPPQTGNDSPLGEGKILQMFSYGSSVSQIVILFDKAVIEPFEGSPSDLKKFNGPQTR
jgi:hypothetical protein